MTKEPQRVKHNISENLLYKTIVLNALWLLKWGKFGDIC